MQNLMVTVFGYILQWRLWKLGVDIPVKLMEADWRTGVLVEVCLA